MISVFHGAGPLRKRLGAQTLVGCESLANPIGEPSNEKTPGGPITEWTQNSALACPIAEMQVCTRTWRSCHQ